MELVIIFLAKYLPYILLGVFFVLFLKKRSWNFLFIPLISALVSRFIFTELIRFFYFRPRPFVEQGFVPLFEHAPSASFPSGHAAFFFALSTGVFVYNKKAGTWFFIGSFLIGFSRVLAGIHYVSDIFGGFAVGLFSFWLVNLIFSVKKSRTDSSSR